MKRSDVEGLSSGLPALRTKSAELGEAEEVRRLFTRAAHDARDSALRLMPTIAGGHERVASGGGRPTPPVDSSIDLSQ